MGLEINVEGKHEFPITGGEIKLPGRLLLRRPPRLLQLLLRPALMGHPARPHDSVSLYPTLGERGGVNKHNKHSILGVYLGYIYTGVAWKLNIDSVTEATVQ